MGKVPGYRTLTGTYAEIWQDGELIAEAKKIEMKITYNHEDVQLGLDVDSKVTGQAGEWTMTLNKVYSRYEEVRQSIRKVLGPDKLAADCAAGGEDFHFFKRHKPSIKAAYFGVGAACAPGLHSRDMHFDSKWLDNGVKVLVDVALKHVG